MMKELNAMSEGDPMPLINGLTSTASALIQMMPKQDEGNSLKDILNPPDTLQRQQPEQGQDNYVNPDLAPSLRPGR